MELTVSLLRAWFHDFNIRYFQEKLPEPRLLVSRSRTQLGQFSCRRLRKGLFRGYTTTGYTIKVSEYYDMEERDYQQTLLHEMIHYYIAFVGAKDTSPHGRLFRELAERLNNAGGWHITVSSRTDHLRARNQKSSAQYLLVLFKSSDNHYFLSVVNPDYRNYIARQAQSSPMIADCRFVVSHDERYATWPRTRTLRGRRITEKEYLQIIANSME